MNKSKIKCVLREERPLITLAFFAYNEEKYIREAVEATFSQTYSPLEIILSDDCSSDSTFSIMQEMAEAYKGPHKVILNKNEVNLGGCPHSDRVFEMCSGEWIVLADGDDISESTRVEILWDCARKSPGCKFVHSNVMQIDETGKDLRPLHPHTVHLEAKKSDIPSSYTPFIMGCALMSRRNVYEIFGPFLPGLIIGDQAVAFRANMIGNIAYEDALLVRYRRRSTSITLGGGAELDYKKRMNMLFERASMKAVLHRQFYADLETAYSQEMIAEAEYHVLNKKIQSEICYYEMLSGAFAIRRSIIRYTLFSTLQTSVAFLRVAFRALLFGVRVDLGRLRRLYRAQKRD